MADKLIDKEIKEGKNTLAVIKAIYGSILTYVHGEKLKRMQSYIEFN